MSTKTEATHVVGPDGAPTPISALYKWSAWCHVGPGSEECEAVDEENGVNDCSNPAHVHLWCRLPNQFQHRDIRERALAAKARRVRQLRSGDSDSAVILEEEMEALARMGEDAKPELVRELVEKDWWRDHLEAVREIREIENEDGTKTFEHIEDDVRRLAEIEMLPEKEQPSEEHEELRAHYDAYQKAMEEVTEANAKPRREALMARDVNDLIDLVRDQRIDVDSNEAFGHTYAKLEWQLCTLTKPNGDRQWLTEELLEAADEAVIEAVKATFEDLERTQTSQTGGGQGNS